VAAHRPGELAEVRRSSRQHSEVRASTDKTDPESSLTVSPEARPPETVSPEVRSQESRSPETKSGSTRLSRPARRLQLLGAARHVFVAQGYHAAAMDEIAERAGVSKPVLYQHFPGKLELYLALLDESADELVKIMSEALSSTTENRQRVIATFKAFYDFVAGTGEAFRLVFESDLSNEPAVRARLDRAMSDCAYMVSQFIREDAGVSEAESHLLGMALVGMAQVSARYWLSTKQEIPKDAAEQLIARLAWRGISGWPMTG
jgi:AcrR family transcriptional regulator